MIRETDSNRDMAPAEGCKSFELEKIRFSYPTAPDIRILHGVSLTVRLFSPLFPHPNLHDA